MYPLLTSLSICTPYLPFVDKQVSVTLESLPLPANLHNLIRIVVNPAESGYSVILNGFLDSSPLFADLLPVADSPSILGPDSSCASVTC